MFNDNKDEWRLANKKTICKIKDLQSTLLTHTHNNILYYLNVEINNTLMHSETDSEWSSVDKFLMELFKIMKKLYVIGIIFKKTKAITVMKKNRIIHMNLIIYNNDLFSIKNIKK